MARTEINNNNIIVTCQYETCVQEVGIFNSEQSLFFYLRISGFVIILDDKVLGIVC